MWPARISDGRGRRYPLCAPGRLPADTPEPVRRAVKRASDHTVHGIAGSLAGTLAVVGTLSLMTFVSGGWRGSWADIASLLLITLSFVVCIAATAWIGAIWGRADAARDACLRERICPACGYRFGEIPPQVGGCTECPECGAAWRLPSA